MSAALLQLKLRLVDTKPPIWRRLLVTNQMSLKRLHECIQIVAGWNDTVEHEFIIAEKRYGPPAPREVVPVQNEALFRLHSLPLAKGASFTYVYDFADHWEVEAKVELVLPLYPGAPFASVTEGARAFPPESGPEDEEHQRGTGDDFDPELFDLGATNRRLSALA